MERLRREGKADFMNQIRWWSLIALWVRSDWLWVITIMMTFPKVGSAI